jgi:hypothetical protein
MVNVLQRHQVKGNVVPNLVMFLLTIAVIFFAGLYFDTLRKKELLEADVARLESTQVLLMVPDEQAEDIANWLKQHPDQTDAIIEFASSNNSDTNNKSVVLGPDVQSEKTDSTAATKLEANNIKSLQSDVIISENEDGVKVISLPNGGIRVTTRELDETESKKPIMD